MSHGSGNAGNDGAGRKKKKRGGTGKIHSFVEGHTFSHKLTYADREIPKIHNALNPFQQHALGDNNCSGAGG